MDSIRTRLEELYTRDIESFIHPIQYDNIVEYWRALDPMVRGQDFAWDKFLPKFEKLVSARLESLVTTRQLKNKFGNTKTY